MDSENDGFAQERRRLRADAADLGLSANATEQGEVDEQHLASYASALGDRLGRFVPFWRASRRLAEAEGQRAGAASRRASALDTAKMLLERAVAIERTLDLFSRRYEAARQAENTATEAYSQLDWIVRAGRNRRLIYLILVSAGLYAGLAFLAAQSIYVDEDHPAVDWAVRVIIAVGAATAAAGFEFVTGTLLAWGWNNARDNTQRMRVARTLLGLALVMLVCSEVGQTVARNQAQADRGAPATWLGFLSASVLFLGALAAMLRVLYETDGEQIEDQLRRAQDDASEAQERADDAVSEANELRDRANERREDAERELAAADAAVVQARVDTKTVADNAEAFATSLSKQLTGEAQTVYAAAALSGVRPNSARLPDPRAAVGLIAVGLTTLASSAGYVAAGTIGAATGAGLATALQGSALLLLNRGTDSSDG